MNEENLIEVGIFNKEFNYLLGIDIQISTIYQSKGLPTHMVNRKHFKCLKYINYISDIIASPDYIGVNPNENGDTIELIKKFKDNVLIGIKLDKKDNYLYISTMHDIQESKIKQRLFSGRLKTFDKNIDTDTE